MLFIWGCDNPCDTLPPQQEHVHTELPSKDSILNLADQVIEYVVNKERGSQTKIDSLAEKISQSSTLSREQLIQMAQEISRHQTEKDSILSIKAKQKQITIIDTILHHDTIPYIDTIKFIDTILIEKQRIRKRK